MGLSCSFCRQPESAVGKLISSPSDAPRVYICDECVAVCSAVIEEGRRVEDPPAAEEAHPLMSHPLASELLSKVERWIRQESLGADAAEDLAEVRSVARRMVAENGAAG